MLVFATFIASCGKDNDSDVRKEARQSLNVQENANTGQPGTEASGLTNPQNMPAPSITQVPVYEDGTTGQPVTLHHYTCPNNCEGSGGQTQVDCPVCGTQYVHNQAYHTQQQQQTQPVQPATTPTTPEPAQNAAGVWHYTCPSGCAGGAGSAVACASCGTTLTHNTAYHN